jgi:hypothetical protein
LCRTRRLYELEHAHLVFDMLPYIHTYIHTLRYFPTLRIAVFRFGTTPPHRLSYPKPVHILYIQSIRLTTCIFLYCKPVPRMYARRIVIDPFHYSFNSRSLRPPGFLRDPVRKSAETPRGQPSYPSTRNPPRFWSILCTSMAKYG